MHRRRYQTDLPCAASGSIRQPDRRSSRDRIRPGNPLLQLRAASFRASSRARPFVVDYFAEAAQVQARATVRVLASVAARSANMLGYWSVLMSVVRFGRTHWSVLV